MAAVHCAGPVHAQSINSWIAGDGNWNTPSNWSLGSVPGPSDAAFITNASPVQVTINSSVPSPVNIQLAGASSTVQIVGGGNIIASGQSFAGRGTGTIGTFTVVGTGSTFRSSVLFVGDQGSQGTVNVQSGGVVNATNLVTNPTGLSNFQVNGAGSQLNSAITAIDGNATLTVTNGGAANLGFVQLNENSAGRFVLNIGAGGRAGTVTTTGSFINHSGAMTVEFDHTDTTTFASALLEAGGTTNLLQPGTGTTILTGDSSYSGGTLIQAGTLQLGNGGASGSITGNVVNNGTFAVNRSDTFTFSGVISGNGAFAQIGSGTTVLTGANTYTGGTLIQAGTLQLGNGGSIAGNVVNNGTFAVNRSDTFTFGGTISGSGAFAQVGSGTTVLTGANTYTGGTLIQAGTLQLGNGGSIAGNVVNNGTFAINRSDTFTFGGVISGSGVFAQTGSGTTVLTGANTYTGGTLIQAGTLQLGNGGTGGSIAGNVVNNGVFAVNWSDTFTLGGVISGSGALVQAGSGTTVLSGTNTYTGPTSVLAGTLAVNGSITSNVAVGGSGALGGVGTIFGNVVNGGLLAPGNSIGTLSVSGNFTQNGGTYRVEANGAGQADRINIGGIAAINGGTVQVLPQPGTYRRNTTYTILRATGGVNGAYSGATSSFDFLKPTLSYDANDVYLTLTVPQNAFYLAGFTPNQRAVGATIDATFDTATGDYATVIGALTGLSAFQAPAALDAMSGQQYADFGTVNVNNSALFMNVLGRQMAAVRGTTGGARRQALAQACETDACEGAGPWTAWASALGGFGSVAGDYNASTATYSLGGGAVGIDYRVDPRFLVGIGTAYTAGNMWVNNFLGRGTTDSVAVAAYGSFTQGGFYADLLGGYAYFNNQLQRQILIPGLQPRTANGSAGANQLLGQIETGYRFGIFAPAAATLTPFARLQGSSVTQNAFAEWGAQSLSLNVSQQTTNSLRSTFGANLAGAIPIGDTRTLDLDLRLGWQHEYANTGRSIMAALSGAPFAAFTVYGATPQRDAAVVGFSARTEVADNTQLYLRYDGEIGSGTANHAVSVGLRLNW